MTWNARAARLHCHRCARPVRRDTPESICEALLALPAASSGARVAVTFGVDVPESLGADEVVDLLARQGYTRIHQRTDAHLDVVQDRVRLDPSRRARLVEALEAALRAGRGRIAAHLLDVEMESVAFEDGTFSSQQTNRVFSFAEVAGAAHRWPQ